MINELYADASVRQRMRDAFHAEKDFPSITLFTFLNPKVYEKMQQDVIRSFFRHEVMFTSHSYATTPLPSSLAKFLQSEELAEFLESILGSKVQIKGGKLLQFAWKDYTLVQDSPEIPAIELWIDFTDYWEENAGGEVIYKDDQGNFIELPRGGNIASVVQRREDVQQYVHYVNHHAGKMRRYLLYAKIVQEPQKNL